MRTLALIAAAACMAALLQTPARAQDDNEKERARQELEASRKELAQSREMLLQEYAAANDKIRELRIRNSGKKSNGVLVLKYGKDGEILSVIDNGKIASKKDFPRYRIRLDEALGARCVDELRPDLERLQEIIESRRLTDEEKIAAVREMTEELENRDSETAGLAREIYLAQLGALGTKRFIHALTPLGLLYDLDEEDGNRITIRIRDDGCYLNGRKLPADLSDRLLELRKEYRDQERVSEPEEPEPPDAIER